MANIFLSYFSLNKFRRILRQNYRLYRRKQRSLDASQKTHLQTLLTDLQSAIAQKDIEKARPIAQLLEEMAQKLMPKTIWDHIRDLGAALIFALVVAIAIRQMWFELYTIPSGSMRPTLKEEDLLLVSKTDFGINTVTRTSHLFFDPNLVQRGSIVIFSVENMDVPDPDTMYFMIIPGKKQYVKRLIGKPGDTLYFYGGQIFGIDCEGRDLKELRDSDWSRSLEHVPFIRFDGKPETMSIPQKGVFSSVCFSQMNEPIAKLDLQDRGKILGEMLLPMKNYFDVWGFKNYAMARLLTFNQIQQIDPASAKDLDSAPLYLELIHHPSLNNASLSRDEYRRLRPQLSICRSVIPLKAENLDSIMRHMITCRFIVQDGRATRFGSPFSNFSPSIKNVPNGTYEIQNGKAYRVLWSGISYLLPDDHPLLRRDPEHVQLLYNLGIEWDNHYEPSNPNTFTPSRYAYFRNQDLFLLESSLFSADDPALVQWQKKEHQRQAISSQYLPFEDMGPPLQKDGQLDTQFIRQFGVQIPDRMYLVLGDNHAMSADSRQFGFVPQENLRGGASFVLWPFGSRWGRLPQPSIDHLAIPNVVIWVSFFTIFSISTIYLRRKYQKPLRF